MCFYADVVEFEHVFLQILIVDVHVSFFFWHVLLTLQHTLTVFILCVSSDGARQGADAVRQQDRVVRRHPGEDRAYDDEAIRHRGSVIIRVNVPCACGLCDCRNC